MAIVSIHKHRSTSRLLMLLCSTALAGSMMLAPWGAVSPAFADGGAGGVGSPGIGGAGGTLDVPQGQDGNGNGGGGGGGPGGGVGGAGAGLGGAGGSGGTHGFNGTVLPTGNLTGGTGQDGSGVSGIGGGGGGGGAGGYGSIITGGGTAAIAGGQTISGGIGGNGGVGNQGDGGNGGDGGVGLSFFGTALTNAGTISGGAGGNGSFGGLGGRGGNGGAGLSFSSGAVMNVGTIGGGSGGAAFFRGDGAGGVGVVGSDLTVMNLGTIAGGVGTGGRANAITFTGGANTLYLRNGSIITGNVVVESGATGALVLGDYDTLPSTPAFDVSKIVATATAGGADEFVGFTSFTKTGSNTVTLTGTGAQNWTIDQGTLVGDTNSFGGNLTFAGAPTARGVVFDQASDGTYAGIIAGSGNITKTGAGTLALSGDSSGLTGDATVSTGKLDITGRLGSRDGTIDYTDGNPAVTATASVVGDGSAWNLSRYLYVGYAGTGTLNITNGGAVTNQGGVIGLSANSAGTVQVTGPNSIWTGTFLQIAGQGTATLTVADGGTAAMTGGIGLAAYVDSSGTLNIGAGAGMAAATPGVVSGPGILFGDGTATLVFNHTGTDYEFAAALQEGGTGTHRINHLAGTTRLTGNSSTFDGTTTISGGSLLVNGTLGGTVNVESGGTLGGNGTVGNTVVDGGRLSPGNSIGALTVAGNLTLTAASTYMVEISPSNADFTHVTGSATLGGATVAAQFASGSYVGKRYTILTADGGVNGTFSGPVNTNLPQNFKSALTHDGNNAYLDLALDYTPPGPTPPDYGNGLNINQRNVATTLVNFFDSTGGIPLAFGALDPRGLSLASGEIATTASLAAFDAQSQFLNMLTDPSAAGYRGAPSAASSSSPAMGYSATARQGEPHDAFAALITKAPSAPSFEQRWRMFGAAYGGTTQIGGNAILGSHDATSRVYGAMGGASYALSPATELGFAFGGGGTSFGLADNLGSGRSEMFQAGVFAHHGFARSGYFSGAFAYGWHDVTADRVAPLTAERLRASYKAGVVSGRVEAGWRVDTAWAGATPYAAAQAISYRMPSYLEHGNGAIDSFALGYAGHDVTATRSELGLRLDRTAVMGEALFTLRGRAAWAHNFDTARNAAATFQALPGTGFLVNGAAMAPDAALVSAGAEITWRSGFALAASFGGEFSNNVSSYTGKGTLRYVW